MADAQRGASGGGEVQQAAHRPQVFKNTGDDEGNQVGWSVSCPCSPLSLINWEAGDEPEIWNEWLASTQPEAYRRALEHIGADRG